MNQDDLMLEQDEEDEDEELELATPWQRIFAAFINGAFTAMMFKPLQLKLRRTLESLQTYGNDVSDEQIFTAFLSNGGLMLLIIFLVYIITQMIVMSRSGQSLGKKMMRIKVIKQDGEKAGFVSVVLVRELVFNFAIGLVIGLIFSRNSNPDIYFSLVNLVCLVMLFVQSERRTLQDMLAGTVVVKLPKETAKYRTKNKKRQK